MKHVIRIYNMDKTGMPLDHTQPKRIAPKGMKKVYGQSSDNKCQFTIFTCSNAVGTVLPPMVIFKGERFNHEWTKGEIPNTAYRMSPQGWIDHELAYKDIHQEYSTNSASVIAARWPFISLYT